MSRQEQPGSGEENPGLTRAEDVRRRVSWVIRQLGTDTPSARAGRARLRQALVRPIEQCAPEVWEYVADPTVTGSGGDGATRGERAVLAALTLWAAHEQTIANHAHDGEHWEASVMRCVHVMEYRRSNGQQSRSDSSDRRLMVLMQTDDFDVLVRELRPLVRLMASSDVPLNYVRLAHDLFHWQFPERRLGVLRQWSRDAARPLSKTPTDD